MGNKIKKRFIPLDLEFHNDIKFREAAYFAKEDGLILPVLYFIHIFEYYCMSAKKQRKNIDVRRISIYSLFETTGLDANVIQKINKYLIKAQLLTKKHTITNYYKWNNGDEELESESENQSEVSGQISESIRNNQRVNQKQSASPSVNQLATIRKKISDRKSVLKTRYKMSESQILSDKILINLNNQLSELINQKSENQLEVSESEIKSEKISESESTIRPPLEIRDKSIEIRDSNKENILTNVKEISKCNELDIEFENEISPFLEHSEKKHQKKLKSVYQAWKNTNLLLPDKAPPIHLWVLLLANKRTITERAIKGELKNLKEIIDNGLDATFCYEKAIEKGWQSVEAGFFNKDKPIKSNIATTNDISCISIDAINTEEFIASHNARKEEYLKSIQKKYAY